MTASSPNKLVRFNPDEAKEVEELKRQRVLCGWNLDKVEVWREQCRRGVKNLYWIHPAVPIETPEFEPLNSDNSRAGPPPPDPSADVYDSFQPVGHISLDWEDYEGDTTLCDREKGIITLATFFILLSQQGKGYGSVVMKQTEQMAVEVGAKEITLNTVDGEYAVQPWWWEQQGIKFDSRLRVNERWYERLGYTAYKRAVPRYPCRTVDGRDILLEAVFMRKKLPQA
ncbi:hypothetical protein NBRC10512v2_005052 [Rhodotorula toruloides]|uniref:N-acetyltransferase domain-containing protein n=1 Tax=Rhodotorula toruloides (strain NP11) TaxID=1130832 RepID=M7WSN8_RHOT1|nr:uncharacterized protein RHTO_01961 [Rhodotorula toruloides NP11]EMS21091.1 hypothetical protein RHTO_01961 [Rhodotorula toruloides NP11]